MKYLIIMAFATVCVNRVWGQGCSDAGFCSLGALKEVNIMKEGKQRLDLGTNIGIGEENTLTVNPYIQYYTSVSKQLSLLGKITGTYSNGFLGNSFGPGDFYGLATYQPGSIKGEGFRLLAGIKIPLTSANAKGAEGRSLPLDYQSSLGTYDVIAGLSYIVKKHFELNAGVQVPVIQANRNTFFPDDYTDVRVQKFAPANQFRRKADLLLRVSYYFLLGKSLILKPGLLGIYHLGEDTYETRMATRSSIRGSRGFTMNGTISIVRIFNNNTRLELIAATPFVVREVRADGLTRSLAINLQYSILF